MNTRIKEDGCPAEPEEGIKPNPAGPVPEGRLWFWTAIVSLAIAAFYILAARPFLGGNSDAGLYLDGARSFTAGHGYRFESFHGRPPIGLYPPGTSLLFTPITWMFPDADAQVTGCLVLLGVITLLGVPIALSLLMRLGLPTGLAALSALSIATSPHWFLSVASLGSDTPFAVLVWIGCWWWLRHSENLTPRSLLPVAGILFLAQLFRSAGLALYVGLIAAELVQNRRRALWSVPILGTSLVAAKLATRAIVPPGGLDYIMLWKGIFSGPGGMDLYWQRVNERLWDFLMGIPFHEAIWPVVARSQEIVARRSTIASLIVDKALVALWFGLLVVMLIAMIRRWKPADGTSVCRLRMGGSDPAVTFVLVVGATVGMIIIAQNNPSHSPRYLLWTFPFVLAAVWNGVAAMVPSDRRRMLAIGAGITACGVIASNAWISFASLRWSIAHHGLEEGKAFAAEIRPRLTPDSTIAASGVVPFIYFGQLLERPLFAELYQYDFSTSPPGKWRDRAQNCTFVITHANDQLEGFAAESGWKEVLRSPTGKYFLYRTDGSRR
jgi:hypothetical protein